VSLTSVVGNWASMVVKNTETQEIICRFSTILIKKKQRSETSAKKLAVFGCFLGMEKYDQMHVIHKMRPGSFKTVKELLSA